MRKVAVIFTLAVLGPSLVLAWLATRSLTAQQVLFERQQTVLYTSACADLARKITDFIAQTQRHFATETDLLLAQADPQEIADQFDEKIRARFPIAEVGFSVTLDGHILAPLLLARPETKTFRLENDLFLSNQRRVEVYWRENPDAKNTSPASPNPKPDLDQPVSIDKTRKIVPQKEIEPDRKDLSKISSTQAAFRQFVGTATDGVLARFIQDDLKLWLWHRPSRQPNLIFGSQIRMTELVARISQFVRRPQGFQDQVGLALVDHHARPVTLDPNAFGADWKHPFVALEIGAELPHWEIALYLLNPAEFNQNARHMTRALGLAIALLCLAIGSGGFLIVIDLKRQLTLARQKTDFVSNVSHELKTPLTAIRMFVELLAEGRVQDDAKRHTYFQIINAEVSRLTRLINNVLDFARIDRGEKPYQMQTVDLSALLHRTLNTVRTQLERNGFKFEAALGSKPIALYADPDAVAQIVLNLLSNAEKYSGAQKEIRVELDVSPSARSSRSQAAVDASTLRAPAQIGAAPAEPPTLAGWSWRRFSKHALDHQHLWPYRNFARATKIFRDSGPGDFAEIRVLDRGVGVPPGAEEKIFQQFYRAHDSLSSGIAGCGLGLALARQMARAHSGDVTFARRPGGGSCFILRLPLQPPSL